ncbi:CotH kinase family protein [Paucisalibacillus globulus]|uniref:CotH kinase family protein n=1 Tax=Paucisalibacillus globulus TaxID=351095 RepID=UPI0003F95477|nr:CotH kinase family protein [Paucisalibacillus globulus]
MLTYRIFVNPKLLLEMKRDIWSDNYQPASLWIDDKKYEIDIFYRGNSVRKHKKKSYHIIFSKPFFMEGQHEIHLNAEYNDPSLMRNKLSFDFFSEIGVVSPQANYVRLYINGVYQGVYLQLDSFDQYFLKRRGIPEGDIVYADDNDANFSLLSEENEKKMELLQGYTIKYDSDDVRECLYHLLVIINTLPDHKFQEQIQEILDVNKYLKWLAGAVCVQNYDGFTQNYALYFNSKSKKFEITPWDYDGTWGRDRHGKEYEHDYIPLEGYNTLTARLHRILEFRASYKQIMHDVLHNQFTVAHQTPIIEANFQELLPYINKDRYYRYEEDTFRIEPSVILKFIEQRKKFLVSEWDKY